MQREKIIEDLYQQSSNFRRIKDKHREYDKKLEEMQIKKFLTSEETVEQKKLKIEKLVLKDKMEEIINENLKKVN